MQNIFLVEHHVQVKDLLSRGMRNKGEWIATGPSSMARLERLGISYRLPEEFYDHKELERICLENHKRVEGLCSRLDEILSAQYPDLKKWEMRPFLFNIFPLTLLFDTVASRIFQLRAILEVYPGCNVWVHKKEQHPWNGYYFPFSYKDTLWAHILSLGEWDCRCEFLKEPNAKKDNSLLQDAKNFIKKSVILKNIAFNLKTKNPFGLGDLQKRKGAVLLHGSHYDWVLTLPLFREKGYKVLFTADDVFESRLTRRGRRNAGRLHNLIEEDSGLMNLFNFMGIKFYGLLQERIKWILTNSFEITSNAISKMSSIIAGHNIRAIMVAATAKFLSHVVQQTGRHFRVPVIVWQHGFMSHKDGQITQLNDFNDMMTSDVLLTYGEEATKAHSFSQGKFSSKIVSVGSASIDKIRKENLKTKEAFEKTILYVTTNYYQTHWYYGLNSDFNDRYLFRDQLAIIKGLDRIAREYKANVTVKLRPIEEPPFLAQFISDLSPELRVVKNSPSFSELLEENHIVIVDLPTTTALEAMVTKKPVFLLTRYIGYSDSARYMLEKRVVCAGDPQEILRSVRAYIEDGIYPADVNSGEYLKAYGTYLNDGKSKERAVEEVLKSAERAEEVLHGTR